LPRPTHFPARPAAADRLARLFHPLDRWLNAVYGAAANPLYQSGSLAVLSFVVLLVTGLVLLWFYKIGAPYDSVAGLQAQALAGRWIRALHIYAGDVMVLAVLVHMVRMLARGRTWGPRVLAWSSGVLMLGLVLLSGVTGLVLVWDVQGHLVAVEGARLLDVLPLFSEPIQRTFISGRGVPSSFFFLNLILHMVIPFLLAVGLWVHTLRVARPTLLPPRRFSLWFVGGLTALAVAVPAEMLPRADYLAMFGEVPVDFFFAFWLVLTREAPPEVSWAVALATLLAALSVPWWWRPRLSAPPAPAWVNPELCTGCTQCYKDCPFNAITMVPAPPTNTGTEQVALVDPGLCVSCGICAGSCAPMVVGPPGRTGRDHLLAAQRLFREARPGPETVVVFSCEQGLGEAAAVAGLPGVELRRLHCAAAHHTSALEYLLRRGTGGVYLLACPERDCDYRHGPRWLHERLYEEREAELMARVDRRRVALGTFGPGEGAAAAGAIRAFTARIRALAGHAADEGAVEPDTECDAPQLKEAAHG